MNVPNKLTISRFLLTIAFVAAFFSAFPFSRTTAMALFIAASITDYYDGMIARRDNLVTNFGILMDPLVDKILLCSAFIVLVGQQWMPAWMTVIIVARELAVTGLRLLAASKSLVLAAETLGKHKTTAQIVAVVSTLVLASYQEWGELGRTVFGFTVAGKPWVAHVTYLSQWWAMLMTLWSGLSYLWRNRQLYLQDL